MRLSHPSREVMDFSCTLEMDDLAHVRCQFSLCKRSGSDFLVALYAQGWPFVPVIAANPQHEYKQSPQPRVRVAAPQAPAYVAGNYLTGSYPPRYVEPYHSIRCPEQIPGPPEINTFGYPALHKRYPAHVG